MSTDSEVLSEIARLKCAPMLDIHIVSSSSDASAAIQQARQPTNQRGRGSYRGYAPIQRGRGSSYPRGVNRSLILNKPPLASAVGTAQPDPLATPASKSKPAVLSATGENAPPVASTSREVVIDGVTFMSDPRGKKLVRKGAEEAAVATPPRASVGGQTYVRTKNGNLVALALVSKRASDDKVKRMTAMLSSNRPFPGSRGFSILTLFSRVPNSPKYRSPRKRGGRTSRKINELCRFFTTTGQCHSPSFRPLCNSTGQCRSGLTCIYQHDPDKLAICPRFVRGKCNLGDACPLSHTADGHRMPHCVHFPNCKYGASCRFPHVHVSANAGICRAFATLGYCARGLACPERHVRECPEFSEKGTCSMPTCRLPHIIRKKAGEVPAAQIEYASDSDDDKGEEEENEEDDVAQHKRKLASSEDTQPPVVIKRKRRLHDRVAEQADFLPVRYDYDSGEDWEEGAEDDADAVQSDVDSDAMGSNDSL